MTPTLERNNSSFQVRQEYLDQYRFFEAQNKPAADAPIPPYALTALARNIYTVIGMATSFLIKKIFSGFKIPPYTSMQVVCCKEERSAARAP